MYATCVLDDAAKNFYTGIVLPKNCLPNTVENKKYIIQLFSWLYTRRGIHICEAKEFGAADFSYLKTEKKEELLSISTTQCATVQKDLEELLRYSLRSWHCLMRGKVENGANI